MMEVDKDNCLSCGLCEYICANGALRLKYNAMEGMYRPYIVQEKCTNCGLCARCCIADSYSDSYTEENKGIGEYRKLELLSAREKKIRKDATSGGVANRLIKYLLKKHVVEAVLMVCQKNATKTDTGYMVITEENVNILDVQPRKFASRYCLVPLLVGLKKLDKYSKVAIVGTPCQIYGVEKCDKLKKKDIIKIGIACSQGISYKATELMLKRRQADDNKIFYRGGGWPGKNTIVSFGKECSEDHLRSLFDLYYSSQIFRNEACNNCYDQFNKYADICFFDYWNDKEIKREHIGKSGVIIRSERLESYITEMIEEGELINHGDILLDDVIESQSWAIKLKTNRKSLGLKAYLKIVKLERKIGIYKVFGEKYFKMHSDIFRFLLDNFDV